MSRLGGGPHIFSFDACFFALWEYQIPMIEDFSYARMDFKGDIDLVLPKGAWWDETYMSLKNVTLQHVCFVFLIYIYIFFFYKGDLKMFLFLFRRSRRNMVGRYVTII
jgi:hypothetical protein